MDATAAAGFLRYFDDLADPRAGHVLHELQDVILIAVMAVICGADGWTEVELFGKARFAWLKTFLSLPNGIPSHDTFGNVFRRLDPDAFDRCFRAWMGALVGVSGGTLVNIDGKGLRRSFEQAWDKSGMAHLVSAFVSAGENRLVFAQVAVQDKENEIVALPKLLELLDLRGGAVVTVDAIGCQREVAAKVKAGGGDYVLALKENQPTLHAAVRAALDRAVLTGMRGMAGDVSERGEEGHGRVEHRRVWCAPAADLLRADLLAPWAGLAAGSVVMVESTRQDLGDPSGKVTRERRYFISSLPGGEPDCAERFAEVIRGHWRVENQLHWQLDVTFREDQRRIRKGHGAENFSRLCRLGLNLLKRDKTTKAGVQAKRLKAALDPDYLLKVLCAP